MMPYEMVSLISLAVLVWMLFFPYNSYRIDRLRQKLFCVRDELFDEACRGEISFDSNAYKATRALCNGAIRFSHRVGFARLLAARFLMPKNPGGESFTALFSASSEADRVLCRTYISRLDVIILNHIFSSPLVLFFVIPHLVWIIASKVGIDFTSGITKYCKKQFSDFNKLAYIEGRSSAESRFS